MGPALGIEQGPHGVAMLGVEPDGRLVEDQKIGLVEGCPDHVGQAPPPARELARRLPRARREAGALDRVRHGRAREPPAESGEARGEEEVLLDCEETVDRGLLEHQAESAPHRPPVAHHVVTEDPGRSTGGGEEGGEEQHRGGLARAVRTQQADGAPARHHQFEPLERAHRAVVAPEPFGLDRGAHARCGSAITR